MSREHNRAIFPDTIIPDNSRELANYYLSRSIEGYREFIDRYSRLAIRTLDAKGIDPDADLDLFYGTLDHDAAIYEARQLLLFCMTLEDVVERLKETQNPGDEATFASFVNTALSMAAGIADLGARITARASEPDAALGKKNRESVRKGGETIRSRRAQEWSAMQDQANRMKQNGATPSAIVRKIVQEFGCHRRTVLRHIKIASQK